MTEGRTADTYEEKPKVSWFLYVATGFFALLLVALVQAENTWGKWLWIVICALNIGANLMQINYARNIKYVLWKRGLSIYLGKSREVLVRFDKALLFKQFKGQGDARKELRAFGVGTPLRSYPIFGGRRRWLTVFERDDGNNQAIVFDPSPMLEGMFRERLKESEPAQPQREELSEPPEQAG